MGMGTAAGSEYLRSQERKHAIVSKLHGLLERYMLRRTKTEVNLLLPPKVEVLVYAPLAREQARILRAICEGGVGETLQAMGWVPVGMDPPPVLDADQLWVILSGILGIAGMRSFEKTKGVASK
jgi:SNF2 family DNA or RNA helicase